MHYTQNKRIIQIFRVLKIKISEQYTEDATVSTVCNRDIK